MNIPKPSSAHIPATVTPVLAFSPVTMEELFFQHLPWHTKSHPLLNPLALAIFPLFAISTVPLQKNIPIIYKYALISPIVKRKKNPTTIFKCWPFPLQQNSRDYICCFLCICSHSASYLLPWLHRSGSHQGHPTSILIIFWSIPLLVLTLLDSAALDNQSLIPSCNASFTQPEGHPLLGLSASPVSFASSTSTPFLTLESPSPSLQISPLSALTISSRFVA